MSDSSALDLWWLADHCGDLAESRLKGTARPWREVAALDPEARARRDDAARREREERSVLAIGEHPSPVHDDVLDLMVDLLATADHLAECVAQAAGVDRMPPAASAFADPRPYLRHAAAHLRAASTDPHVAELVELEGARLRSAVSVALGMVTDGQTLKALCPWCAGGVTGAFTLRVRTLPGGEVAVVCHGVCEPPAADVGTWWKGRPAWPLATEGVWLADRIAGEHAA